MSSTLISRVTFLLCVLVLGGLFVTVTGNAQSTAIFASNFDAVLRFDRKFSQIRSRIEVRDGSAFPVEFENHKLQIHVSSTSQETFSVELSILEKSQGDWFEINAESIEFSGTFGIPVEYKWSGLGVQLDLAIVLSRARQ